MGLNKDYNKAFLGYLHSFRGFAILSVVAGHALGMALLVSNNWQLDVKDNVLLIINKTLFHNSTIYFALISGVLFSAVLKRKGYLNFYKSKLLNVLLPYLIFTMLFSLLKPPSEEGIIVVRNEWYSYGADIFSNLVYGTAQYTFWYIPVLICLFAITPVLDFIVMRKNMSATAIVIILAAPLFFSRTASEISMSTIVYFCGTYAMGMQWGYNLEKIIDWIDKRFTWFTLAAVATSVLLVFLEVEQIEFVGPVSMLQSLWYIQKLSVSAIVLVWLRKREEHQPKWLFKFADGAFSIYFVHGFLLFLLVFPFYPILVAKAYYPFDILLCATAMLALVLLLSRGFVKLFQRLFGRYSRMMIGS